MKVTHVELHCRATGHLYGGKMSRKGIVGSHSYSRMIPELYVSLSKEA